MGTSSEFDGISSESHSSESHSPAPQEGPGRIDPDSAGDGPLGVPAWLWSVFALALGLGLTLWAAQVQQQRAQTAQQAALERVAESGFASLQQALRSCELLVRSLQTVFLVSGEVTAQEFSRIHANLHPRQAFPSLQAMAYARREAETGGGAGAGRYVTALVAPAEGNQRVFGLVVNDQPGNLAAILRSRDSDQPALSAPFRLVQQDDAAAADGVTLRLPVYGPGAPPRTVDERRARMRGSLAVSFRVGDLIEMALPEDASRQLHIEVSDVTGGEMRPLYDSHRQAHVDGERGYLFDRELAYGGRVWRVAMHPVARPAPALAWTQTLLPGLLASTLLALLVWSVATTRRRALELGWRMSRRYRESEERFRALNELLPALVLLASGNDGRITYANQAARNRLGDALGQVGLTVLFEDAELREQLQNPQTADCSNVEAVLRSTNGDRFWASVSIARVLVGGRSQLLMVASDVSEQRQLTDLLSYQASHDALTELYNRREFERRIERVLDKQTGGAPPSALLYLDLDQFKLINDTSGHIAGDQLLTQLAGLMREQLRGGDVLGRLGGDEFGVLATDVDDEVGARLVAERIRERIDGYVFMWEQRSYTITASIGGVMIEHAGTTLKDLFSQADTACYMAKESGRNRVHFYSEQDDETIRRRSEMEWVNRLRWAMDENRLLLDYQEMWPLQGDPDDGPHIELLLRLRDEDGRVVLPGAFIPAAERYGLMPTIDRWVIETALSNFNNLHRDGPGLQLCTINLSGASIEDESLALLVLDLLQRHQVAPERVCFEITETVAVRNLTQVTHFIERLRAVGCRIALDDFGAGMSSFGYLKNLPVDMIKIDGSFIRDMGVDEMSHAIVRAVTDIGHKRGLIVIAEWVINESLVDTLVEMGVDYAQGFALHKPELAAFQRGTAAAAKQGVKRDRDAAIT